MFGRNGVGGMKEGEIWKRFVLSFFLSFLLSFFLSFFLSLAAEAWCCCSWMNEGNGVSEGVGKMTMERERRVGFGRLMLI